MVDRNRTANLLGAASLAVVDRIFAATEDVASLGASGPAALVVVGDHPGIGLERLRQLLDLTHSGSVRLVDRLETAGLVRRCPGGDRRSRAVFLTTSGESRRRALLDERMRLLVAALAGFDERQTEALEELLSKLIAGLTPNDRAAYRACRLCDGDVCIRTTCPAGSLPSQES